MTDKPFVARGFRHRRASADAGRLPTGQYETRDFPVLSAGPTPRTPLTSWDFAIRDAAGRSVRWSWEELQALPHDRLTVDIHCFTKWCYTTNLPLADVTGAKAWIVFGYNGAPLPPEHGGPARLLVPHLYFWKSAKWVRGFELLERDEPGFWEQLGYHNRGDPWREQRYHGDP